MRRMLLNLTAVYGLRAMATLAGLGAGETLNAAELSERTGVPQQYLSKVMRRLVVAKLVRSQRGHGGGFGLARPAAKIALTDVLRAIDIEFDGGCAFGYEQCDPANPCVLHPIWTRLQQGLDAWASDCTLANLGAAPAGRTRRRGS